MVPVIIFIPSTGPSVNGKCNNGNGLISYRVIGSLQDFIITVVQAIVSQACYYVRARFFHTLAVTVAPRTKDESVQS